MSSNSSGYNSGEDVQQAKPAFKQQQLNEPFLSTTSPINMVPSANEDKKDSGYDKISGGQSYQPPAQSYYQSETQVLLDDFHAMFQEEAGTKYNERDGHKGGDDSNDEEVLRDDLNKLQLFQFNSPKDATGCSKIQTLREYILGIQHEQKNPKTNFFDLSRDYYTGRYKGDNKRTIVVKSYLITEDYQNYVKDLSMDIIQTNQGCMPIIKTFEWNAYNRNKFVKALKFYNYKGDCKLKKQIIVDEGVMCDKFRTYDTSLLHFENSIIFYKREENWHKLQKYDVVTNELEEIPGYNIEEPIGEQIRYHVMFSSEFGKGKKMQNQKYDTNKRSEKLAAFLSKHYVFCQSYRITEDIEYINKSLIGFKLTKVFQDRTQQIKTIHLPEIDSPKPRSQMDKEALQYPIQYVCHINDKETGLVKFIAFDSFYSHHFTLNPHENRLSPYKSFFGNNETHMQDYHKRIILDENVEEQTKHSIDHCPFLKHQNAQFTIQKEKVRLTITEQNKEIDQYFYMTNDNQYMLIYPNYENTAQKNQVIFQLAQRHQYNPNPDIDYDYQDDYDVRKRDYLEAKYKKVSHICINAYRSKNYMKRARHIKDIVKYERDFNINDKIILSTDQQSNLIYIYQSSVITGENHIEIFNYENNIVNTKPATTLPKQIEQMERLAQELYQEKHNRQLLPPPHTTYYVNSKYRRVVSTVDLIKTDQKTKIKINLELLDVKNPDLADQIREKIEVNENCREQYHDLNFNVKLLHKDTFVIIENTKGTYMSVRAKLETCTEKLRLQMYCRNKQWYTFFFTLTNEKDKQNVKQHFFAIRRTIREVEELGQNNNDAIVTMDKDITVFQNNEYSSLNERDNLQAYTRKMTFKDLIDLQKQPQPWLVNLGFEKCMDSRTLLDFVPLIYQERSSQETHHLIVFDVNRMQVSRHYSLLSNLGFRNRLRKTAAGFGVYTLTRTSDIFNQKQGMFLGHSCNGNQSEQIAKYQVFSQYYMNNIRLPEVYDDHDAEQGLNPANCTIELQEFAIHFSCCGQNRIQLVGVKQMLISETAQEERRSTFTDLFVIPWIDRSQVIKGSQFVLREFGGDYHMQVIRMLDQEINTLFQHASETIQYGHQKFLTSEDSHEDYILVISSQLRQKVYMEYFFDNSESYWIHHKVIKKLLSMQLAKFEYFVLNDDFEALMREEFYQAQEVLQGKSINDLCLGFPREIAIGLKQPYEQYSSIKGSLIEEISNGEENMMESYEKMDLCEKNLLIQLDFNFCSSLRIAAELNSNQSVKQLLSRIFEINDIKYQEIFMLELPRLLQLPRIERLYGFLTRDYEERKANEEENALAMASDDKVVIGKHLNFEDVINHPSLPQFLSKEKNYHIKYRFKDFHNDKREIVDELVNLNEYDKLKVKSIKSVFVPQKYRRSSSIVPEGQSLADGVEDPFEVAHTPRTKAKKGKQEQRNIEVEHSSINFTKVIIGEKIRGIQEHDYRPVNFNDNHLASIFYVDDDEYLDFYDLEAVRKIIDFQFVRTKEFLKFIMLFYIFGFLIPFMLSLSVEIAFFLNILYNICLFTQIWFIIFEFLQIKEQKLEYFMDFWNILDSSQFLLFFLLYCIKMKNQFQTDSLFEIFVQSFLLFQSFYKMIYFLRIFEGFNNVYQISCLIVKDMYFLILLAGMFILAFTKQFTVMHNGINDQDGEYDGIHSNFLRLVIQTYKSTRGDFATPTLDSTMADKTRDNVLYRGIMLTLNLTIALIQEGTFIYLGALFFSQILQFYEKYTPKLPTYMYKTMAKFNNECYDIVDMFLPQRNFKVVCFAIARNFERNFGYQGFVREIQNRISAREDKHKYLLDRELKLAEERHSKLLDTKGTIAQLHLKVDQIDGMVNGPRNHRCHCQKI